MHITEEYSTPTCVLDPWNIWVAVLRFLTPRPKDTAVVFEGKNEALTPQHIAKACLLEKLF
jgi:hypothetical protein